MALAMETNRDSLEMGCRLSFREKMQYYRLLHVTENGVKRLYAARLKADNKYICNF